MIKMTTDIASLMMVCYNRLALTTRTLEGLKTSIDTPFRLLLVDNGSSDGSVEYLKALKAEDFPHCVGIDLLLNEKNLGIATGRNQGLKLADKYDDPWLCCIDNDVECPNGWLSECIAMIKANPQFSIGVNMEKVRYPLKTFNGKTIQLKDRGNLGSALMVFPRSLHRAIGFFDIMGKSYYSHEDALWGLRSRLVSFHLGYLERDGEHFGDGELDQGEYREFKNKHWDANMPTFHELSRAYYTGKKPLYVQYSEQAPDLEP
jgi:glycosyltransferase involved in cell wall biosynthesis